jgi:glycosyltransferase involved in cell wall biosynthesis
MTLVSVIVPAYNAADTLAQTLHSARAQTHRDLEIILVDDGSTDRTADICAAHAAEDERVQLFRRPNGGVARARNLAIEKARGEFIAPLDADDLWHPQKLDLQLERFAAVPEAGLVYSWFRPIDEAGSVIGPAAAPRVEGWVLHRHLAANFISNGSTPLIRRQALEGLAYEPALRDAGNEGCEDYLLQLRIARRWPFACAPAFLTGYRRRSGAMSSDVARMLRSHLQVFEMIAPDAPDTAAPIIRRRQARFQVELVRNRLRRGLWTAAGRAMASALRLDPAEAARTLIDQIALIAAPVRTGKDASGAPFSEWAPEQPSGPWRPDRFARDRRYQRLDLAQGPKA